MTRKRETSLLALVASARCFPAVAQSCVSHWRRAGSGVLGARAGGAHLLCAQIGALAEPMAHCQGGEGARDFLVKDPGSLSFSLIPVIFFYVL